METKFWELSLYFPRELLIYFQNLKADLKSQFKLINNCISILICDKDLYSFMMAIPYDIYQKNILMIKQKIAHIILLYYKPKIILSAIKNFNLSNRDNLVLLSILSNFDELDDTNEILKSLSLCGKIYIDSYVHFKLCSLKKRWQEIGNLINENSSFLIDETVRKELMRFLMTGISSKTNFAKISLQNNRVVVESEKFLAPQSLYYSQTDYDNLLFAIIGSKPKKIEVEDYKNFDVSFIQELSYLFGKNLILKE